MYIMIYIFMHLKVVAEVCLDIRHNLLSHAEIKHVQRVFSHPQALAQSRGWLQVWCKSVAVCDSVLRVCVLKCVSVCCSVLRVFSHLQAVAPSRGWLQVWCKCVAVCCSVLQYVLCVLKCVAVCCEGFYTRRLWRQVVAGCSLFVLMCTHMYIYVYLHIYVHVCIYMYIYMYIHMYICIYIHVYTYLLH